MSKSVANPEKLKEFLNKRVRLKINHSREVDLKILSKLPQYWACGEWWRIEHRWRGSFKASTHSWTWWLREVLKSWKGRIRYSLDQILYIFLKRLDPGQKCGVSCRAGASPVNRLLSKCRVVRAGVNQCSVVEHDCISLKISDKSLDVKWLWFEKLLHLIFW